MIREFVTFEGERRSPDLALELLATDALIAQAIHRSRGVVRPSTVYPEWYMRGNESDVVSTLSAKLKTRVNVAALLDSFWPQHDEYHKLVERRREIQQSKDVQSRAIVAGPALKH